MSRPIPGATELPALATLPERAWMAAALAVLLAGLLALAWMVPLAAVAIVWPLLFFVPGWVLLASIAPRLAAPARAGLAVVLSVALATHLVYWLAIFAGGYGRGAVFAAAGVLALSVPLGVLADGGTRSSSWGRRLRRLDRSLRRDRGAFGLAALAAAFVGLVLAAGIWRTTPFGVNSGGSNWSDLGVHLSIAESLNAGNFPPEVPYFAGAPLVYHWFADFHAAIAAEAAGLFAVPVMVVQSAALAGALALLVHGLARQLLPGPGAQRAALVAAALVIFGGGMGYIRFVADVVMGVAGPLELISRNSYDNQWLTGWPYFSIPSVMGTGLLAHRATTAGLPMLAGSLLLLAAALPSAARRRAGWRDRPALIGLAGLLGALLAPFHFFFFPAVLLLALLYVLVAGRLVDRDAPRNALAFLVPFALTVPFALPPLLQATGAGALKIVQGWESAPMADGPAAVAFFYLTNLGVVFVLALVALTIPGTPRRWFLGAWLVAMFAVPNVVQVSVIGFDMNKYFQVMWIAAALLAAWLVRRWPAPALAAVFLLAMPSPLLVAGWTASSNLQILTTDELAAADWMRSETPERSVFVTDGWVNSPTDAAGRLRLTTFGPYIANLGYSPDERISRVQTIYCGGSPTISAEFMRALGAAYVVDAARPSPCPDPVDFGAGPFELVFERPTIRIWQLTE